MTNNLYLNTNIFYLCLPKLIIIASINFYFCTYMELGMPVWPNGYFN